MSMRVGSDYLGDGSFLVGNGGFGVLAENVPSTGENGAGYLYNDLDLPADNGKEVMGRIVRWPTLGTLAANENSGFEYNGLTDSFDYQLYVGGVLTGSPATVDLIIGGATTVNATLATVGVSAFDATIVTTTNTIVSATLAGAGVSGFDASIVVGNATIVNASLATIGVSAFDASVISNIPTIVNATVAGIGVTAYQASIVSGVPVDIVTPIDRQYYIIAVDRSYTV